MMTMMMQRALLVASTKRSFSTPPPHPYLSSTFSLQGRSCLITGGGTGIGAALATGLARAGAKVVLTGRREAPLLATCDAIAQVLEEDGVVDAHTSVYALPCDVTDYSLTQELVQDAGRLTQVALTILINNAGVNVRQQESALTSDHWEQSLDLMLTAPFMLTRAMMPGMIDQGYGRVISIASFRKRNLF